MAADAVTTTSTVLVTDVVGSTAMRSVLGEDRAETLRREHDALIAQSVNANNGVVVKGLGDGVLARFDAAADAVAAAVAIQQVVSAYGRTHPESAFDVRVGISAGDISLERDDIFGTPVIEATRLCAAADGGQILVAELVRLLARGRGGHDFQAIGPMALKGLAEPVLADEVRWVPLVLPEQRRGETDLPLVIPLPEPLQGAERFPYAGRVDACDRVRQAWKRAGEGHRQVVLLSGEPGVGKTRLAAEIAREAAAEGSVVLFGRGDDETGAPYRVIAEALRHLVTHAPADLIGAHLGARGGVLHAMLPDLVEGADLPIVDRAALFDAATDLLARAAARSPVVLVLDDLHWADHSSLLFLRHLVRSTTPMALCVIGTYRDTDVVRTHPLALTLADLRRERDVERIALSGFDTSEVGQLMALAGGTDNDNRFMALAEAIRGHTGGNPFFVGEMLVHLAESGAIYQQDGRWTSDARSVDDLALPEGIREVIGRRLSELDAQTNEILRVAAVVGVEFNASTVASLVGIDADLVVESLEEPLRRGLVAEGSSVDCYRFPHALMRQTLYEELSLSRRVRLHARAVDAIEVAGGTLEERAHHALASAAVAAPERAVMLAAQAAGAAHARLAFEQAADWYRRALEAEELLEPINARRRCELLIGLAAARGDAGEGGAARAEVVQAAELARTAGDPVLLGRAAALYGGGIGAWLDPTDTTGVALADEALAALPDDEPLLRAQVLLARLAWTKFSPDADERVATAREVERLAVEADDLHTRIFAVTEVAEARRDSHDPATFDAVAAELEALAQGLEVGWTRPYLTYVRTWAALRRGDLTEFARQTKAQADRFALQNSLPSGWFAYAASASLRAMRGDFSHAWRDVEACANLGYIVGATGELVASLQRIWLLELTGQTGGLIEAAEAAVAAMPLWFSVFYPGDAWTAMLRNDNATAEALAEAYVARVDQLPANMALTSIAFSSRIAPVLSPSSAERLYQMLMPARGAWTGSPEAVFGSASAALARYAARAGRRDDAVALWREALDSHERAGEVALREGFEREYLDLSHSA